MKDEIEFMHVSLFHKFSHTAPNRGELTGQLRIIVTTEDSAGPGRAAIWLHSIHSASYTHTCTYWVSCIYVCMISSSNMCRFSTVLYHQDYCNEEHPADGFHASSTSFLHQQAIIELVTATTVSSYISSGRNPQC
jgi:hypothetical protein